MKRTIYVLAVVILFIITIAGCTLQQSNITEGETIVPQESRDVDYITNEESQAVESNPFETTAFSALEESAPINNTEKAETDTQTAVTPNTIPNSSSEEATSSPTEIQTSTAENMTDKG